MQQESDAVKNEIIQLYQKLDDNDTKLKKIEQEINDFDQKSEQIKNKYFYCQEKIQLLQNQVKNSETLFQLVQQNMQTDAIIINDKKIQNQQFEIEFQQNLQNKVNNIQTAITIQQSLLSNEITENSLKMIINQNEFYLFSLQIYQKPLTFFEMLQLTIILIFIVIIRYENKQYEDNIWFNITIYHLYTAIYQNQLHIDLNQLSKRQRVKMDILSFIIFVVIRLLIQYLFDKIFQIEPQIVDSRLSVAYSVQQLLLLDQNKLQNDKISFYIITGILILISFIISQKLNHIQFIPGQTCRWQQIFIFQYCLLMLYLLSQYDQMDEVADSFKNYYINFIILLEALIICKTIFLKYPLTVKYNQFSCNADYLSMPEQYKQQTLKQQKAYQKMLLTFIIPQLFIIIYNLQRVINNIFISKFNFDYKILQQILIYCIPTIILILLKFGLYLLQQKSKKFNIYQNDRHRKIYYALNRKIYHFYMLVILKLTNDYSIQFYTNVCSLVTVILFILELYRGSVCIKQQLKFNPKNLFLYYYKYTDIYVRDTTTYTCINHIELVASTVFSLLINDVFDHKYENLMFGTQITVLIGDSMAQLIPNLFYFLTGNRPIIYDRSNDLGLKICMRDQFLFTKRQQEIKVQTQQQLKQEYQQSFNIQNQYLTQHKNNSELKLRPCDNIINPDEVYKYKTLLGTVSFVVSASIYSLICIKWDYYLDSFLFGVKIYYIGISVICGSLETISIDDNLMLPICWSIFCIAIEKLL